MATWWRRYYYFHCGDQDNSRLKNGYDNVLSLEEILIYCLDILKIKDDESEIRRNTIEYIKKIPIENVKSYNEWLTATRIIADIYAISNQGCNGNYIFFSQSQVSDFLTLATKGIGEKEFSTRKKSIIFNIFRDIIENYQNFDCILKSNYPQIIVDVMLILHTGSDAAGKKISVLGIDEYYKLRKSRASEETLAARAVDMHTTTRTITTTRAEHLKKDHQIQEQLIQLLIQITGRRSKELEESLTILHNSDIKKISDLCANYNKIEKYCKLLGSKEGFRNELEREIGRKLTDNQVQSAAISIRKVRKYIENLLDGTFIPHDTHGINHIKHNLEYGYQVMDLIGRKGKGIFSSH
jgi:hypothetical protein